MCSQMFVTVRISCRKAIFKVNIYILQGTAVGNLYIDDYHTFQYKNGEYTHREFIFENKKLENK